MGIIIAGNRNGRRVIRWSGIALVASILISLPTVVSEGVYYVVTERWSTEALLAGLGTGLVVTVIVVTMSLRAPLQRLPMIS